MLTAPRKRLPFIGASQADPMLLFDGFSLKRRPAVRKRGGKALPS
jgi:hypothetical protein